MSGNVDPDFAAFEAAGTVEVGAPSPNAPAPAPRRAPPKPAVAPAAGGGADEGGNDGADGGNADAGGGADDEFDLGNLGDDDDDGGEGGQGEGGDDDGDEGDGRRETPEGRIKRIKRERAEAKRERDEARAEALRLRQENEALKNGGLPTPQTPANSIDKLGPEPDPNDQAKYPLGTFDAQYIKDSAAWSVKFALAQERDADLQRQQESQIQQRQQQQQQKLLDTVKSVSDKGSAIYDDFQTVVVDAGMKGSWDLSQATFEAAAEVDHGARILYNLAKNPTEATRVSKLSPFQQARYVDQKNTEIAERIAARKRPKAGAPPTTHARGGNSRTAISPATDNLDDFEKLFDRAGKK